MKVNKISIFSPHKDQCDFCSSYEMNQICEDDYAVHLAYKESAREEKQLDKSRAQKMKYIVLLWICKLLNFVHL